MVSHIAPSSVSKVSVPPTSQPVAASADGDDDDDEEDPLDAFMADMNEQAKSAKTEPKACDDTNIKLTC